MDPIHLIKPLIVGGVVGLIFAIIKLPIPAPDSIESMLGVIGLFAGYFIFTKLF